MTQKPVRRRQLVTDRSLQSSIIFAVSWPSAICILLCGMVLAVYFVQLSYEALQAEVTLPSMVPVFAAMLSFLILSTGFLLHNALRVSHRVAGPMVRIGKVLEAFRGGDRRARIRLREGDYLTPVADDMNRFLDWVEQQAPSHSGMASSSKETAPAVPALHETGVQA